MTPALPTPDSAPTQPSPARRFNSPYLFDDNLVNGVALFTVLLGFLGLFTLAVFIYPSIGQNLDAEARSIIQLRSSAEYIELVLRPGEQAAGLPLASNQPSQEAVLAKLDAMAAPLQLIREAGRSSFLLIDRAADRKIRAEFSREMTAALGSYHELVGPLRAGPPPAVSSRVIFLKIENLLSGYEWYLTTLREYQRSQLRWTALTRTGLIGLFCALAYYWFRRFKKFQQNREAELQQAVKEQTAQINAQNQAQQAQAEYLKLIYQGSRDAIGTIDGRTQRFSSCNAATLTLFGFTTEAEFCAQVPGALSSEYQPDGQLSAQRSVEIITQAFKEGSLTFEWLWKRRDGSTFWGLATLDRLQEGDHFFLLGTIRDLTAQQELARQRKIYEEQLLASASSLATSEAHYRALFEYSADAIGTIDPVTLRYKSANAALLKMFGLRSEAALFSLPPGGLSPEFQPDGRRSVEAALERQRQMNEAPSSSIEWHYKRADGIIFAAQITQVRVMIGGRPIIVATTRDLTKENAALEQERADKRQLAAQAEALARIAEELKTSQEHYRAIFEHTADTVGTVDPLTARYTSCNPAALKMFGVASEADFLAIRPGALSPAFQPDGQPSPVKAASLFKQMLTQEYYTGEWLFQRSDGYEFLAQLTFSRVHVREKVFILATVRDLTLPKAAEKMQQLQAADLQQLAQDRQTKFQLSENRYRSLVDASPDAILVVAPSGKIDLVNPAATSLFGYAFSELRNRSVEQLIPAALANSPAASRSDKPPASKPRSLRPAVINLNARRKDGSEFPAEISLSSVASPDGAQVIWVVRDGSIAQQTARQMAVLLEQEKNVSQMKTRFISLTSHEFRTPMAAAMGSVEILTHHLDRLDQVKRQSLLVRITASLQHMNRMLDDILLLNRADAARVELRLRSVDLGQELQSILQEGELGDGAQHTFHFAPPTADPAFVSDPNLLQHIFSNLLSNAVRYSPVGTTITLRLSFTVDSAIVEVEDQGIGIPLADQARIFDPFERGSNIGQIAGTGLGLNIVQRMVGLLQGTVAVSSITAGGTKFTVVLPRVITPAPQP